MFLYHGGKFSNTQSIEMESIRSIALNRESKPEKEKKNERGRHKTFYRTLNSNRYFSSFLVCFFPFYFERV